MNDEIAIITVEQLENLIYEIRDQKVMLDVDLAKIYGYETKNFNRQVVLRQDLAQNKMRSSAS